MYGLQEHINGSLAMPLFIPDAEWSQIDQCIISWLYTSVSKAIRDIILQPANTAARAWSAIVALFLDNHLQCTINVKDEFHTLQQGDLSITVFASKIKCLADTLHDIGLPVTDHDMLLALLNGLGDGFGLIIAAMMLNQHGIMFASARSALLQEERRLNRVSLNAQATAFYAQQQASTPPSTNTGNTGGGKGKNKGKPKTGGVSTDGASTGSGSSSSAAGSSSITIGPRAPSPTSWQPGPYPLSGMFQA
jgi:hypothetical protein